MSFSFIYVMQWSILSFVCGNNKIICLTLRNVESNEEDVKIKKFRSTTALGMLSNLFLLLFTLTFIFAAEILYHNVFQIVQLVIAIRSCYVENLSSRKHCFLLDSASQEKTYTTSVCNYFLLFEVEEQREIAFQVYLLSNATSAKVRDQ